MIGMAISNNKFIIICTCCEMCSSCVEDNISCVTSYCEVLTNSIGRPRSCAPLAVIHAAAAAHAPISQMTLLQWWHSQVWRPATAAVGVVGLSVPVASLQFPRFPLELVMRLIIIHRAVCGSSARLYIQWVAPNTPVRRPSTFAKPSAVNLGSTCTA